MSFAYTDCIFIMGRRGCGKSYLAKKLQQIWPRRIIIDPTGEYTDKSGKAIFKNAIVVHDFSEFGKKIIELEKLKKFVLIFQPGIDTRNFEAEFDEICRVCYYLGNIQMVLEELQLYASTHQIPHWLKQLMLTGRHQNISLLFTSQRPGQINKTVFSQCIHIFCGSIIEGNDLRYVANFLNQDFKILTMLPDREFLWRSPKGVKKITNNF